MPSYELSKCLISGMKQIKVVACLKLSQKLVGNSLRCRQAQGHDSFIKTEDIEIIRTWLNVAPINRQLIKFKLAYEQF
ncbi:hypothetical protein HI914_06471 [Erysiphe necator]|nr:hypothetical protein HI914_06471 [Erysiphe necator]